MCVPVTARSEQTRDRTAGVGERNAIRRALRREAAWRRRRNVVLLKVYLDKQHQLKAAAVGAGEGVPLPTFVGGGASGGDIAGASSSKRKGSVRDTNVQPPVAKLEKPAAEAEEGADGVDDFLFLQITLEGVANLAGHEEALFRQIVMFL